MQKSLKKFDHLDPEYLVAKWYLLQQGEAEGPFAYVEIIRMMQEKKLATYNFVWCYGMETWKLLSKIPEFHPFVVKQFIKGNKDGLSQILIERKSRRVIKSTPILVHNNYKLWEGKTENISIEGALIKVNTSKLLAGDFINIYFRNVGQENISFMVQAQVIVKLFKDETIIEKSTMSYGIKFLNIEEQGRNIINKWVNLNTI